MNPLEVVERYFSHLEAGEMWAAAACFTEGARYSHPPYAEEQPGSARHEVVGRSAIAVLFKRRGRRPTCHRIVSAAVDDGAVLLAGEVHDWEGSLVATFMSRAEIDDGTGLIADYVAYSSRPPAWATGENTAPKI